MVALVLGVVVSGCALRVEPPAVVERPVTVHLVEHGMHGGLLLPLGDGRMVHYDYGEWAFYALDRAHWTRIFPALFWPTRGTLARRVLPGVDQRPEALRAETRAQRLWTFRVEADRAADLVGRLEARFLAARSTLHYDDVLDTEFVHDPDDYHLYRTCNHVVADWLDDLGCRSQGAPWTWDWSMPAAPRVPPRGPPVLLPGP